MNGFLATAASQPIDYVPYNAWSVYWLTWFALFIPVTFLPPELYAIASGHPENTLSAQIWRIAHVVAGQSPAQWAVEHWLFAVAFLLLFSWLIVHFDLGWLR